MKIVHSIATMSAEHGGPTKACLEMAEFVAKSGHEVVIHTSDYKIPEHLLMRSGVTSDCGVTIHYHKCTRFGPWTISDRFGPWAFAPGMIEGLRADIETCDAVHLHSLYLLHDYYTWKLCQEFGKPYIVQPHGTLNPVFRQRHRFRKWVVNRLFMDRVIDDAYALLFACKNEEDQAQPAIRGKKGVIIPNGLDTRSYSNLPSGQSFRSLFPDDPKKKIILFLGRLNFIKGLDLLADAFAMLRARNPHAFLLVAGPDGGMEEKFKRWLAEKQVAEFARFTGMITGDEKLAAFDAADVFVLPSYSENFGISAVEAMAAGIPTIITDQVNIHHEIAKDGAGIVIPCSANSLYENLAELLESKSMLDGLAIQARNSIKDRYDWDVITPSLVGVYREMGEDTA